MKIYTRVEYGWDAAQRCYVVLRSEHFDYVGPIARCDPGDAGGDTGGGDTGGSDKGSDPGLGADPNAPDPNVDPDINAPAGGPSADAPAPSSASNDFKIPDVLKGAGDVATKSLAQAGVLAGVNAVANRKASSQADAFNKQLSGLVSNANTQSYNSAQAVPITPGLSGSTGTAKSPAATVANMNLPAPVSSTSGAAAGTQAAPNSPAGTGQTGAIKLGVRPQVYA